MTALLGSRVLFGLDRPPRGVAWDHPRVPSVVLGPKPLRLNSHPVPAAFLPAGIRREDRRAAVREWLETACGDYAVARVRFIAAYLAFIEDDLERSCIELAARTFDALYQIEDWTWSALRPLPRAWIELATGAAAMDFAFWDGTRLYAVQLSSNPQAHLLEAAGIVTIGASDFPTSFRTMWRTEPLPASPFRRPIPPP